jgi:hypothetical protein
VCGEGKGIDHAMLDAFISYSHADRRVAGKVKQAMSDHGIDCFLAHEDIEPSEEWLKKIKRRLRAYELFFPLVSDNFKQSLWADQECGIAIALKKDIVPFQLGAMAPYGFIGRYQPVKIRSIDKDEISQKCWAVVRKLLKSPTIGTRVQDALIESFLKSKSFEESERKSVRLAEIGDLSIEQLNTLLEGSALNVDVFDGYVAREAVRKLLLPHRKDLDRQFYDLFMERAGFA